MSTADGERGNQRRTVARTFRDKRATAPGPKVGYNTLRTCRLCRKRKFTLRGVCVACAEARCE
ncbi:MAG: hypothetical protein KGL39_20610 [Patescibacteria group bacterium]|nr:hypothetical protein [Patescibacteria group bacterium]